MTARALMQGTGLAVDNSEAVGILSDTSIDEADIEAGKFDGASVEAWLVNWQDPTERMLRFRGALGEITRTGSEFTAELRGLTDKLNQAQGRSYTPSCQAVLGDAECRVDLSQLAKIRRTNSVIGAQVFHLPPIPDCPDRWFERGTLQPQGGLGQWAEWCHQDRPTAAGWRPDRDPVGAASRPGLDGTDVKLTPGCDKRRETCRDKFTNIVNFRGFPFIPGEDWLVASPRPEAD